MQTTTQKRQILLALLAALVLVASGCAGSGAPPAASNTNPTVVIVQYVTQVVATVTPAPPTLTPLPATAAPVEVVNSGGFDPYRVEVYYPLMGCPVASRIHVGERVYVANNRNGTLGLHMSANVGYAPIFRDLRSGEVLDVIDGPFCRTESLVWEVVDGDGQNGFVSEGNGEEYWLLPMGEKVDKKLLRPTQGTGVSLLRMGLPKGCRPR